MTDVIPNPIPRTELRKSVGSRFGIAWTAALLSFFGLASTNAWAWEEGMSHVVVIQSQYMPNFVYFTADTGTASCPAGTWLHFGSSATQSTNQAVFATVLAAINTGNRILYFVTDGDTTCTVQIVYEYGTP